MNRLYTLLPKVCITVFTVTVLLAASLCSFFFLTCNTLLFSVCPKAAIPLNSGNGKFSSPGYPERNVPAGMTVQAGSACTWKITVAAGKRVKLFLPVLNFGSCSSPCSSNSQTLCTHLDIYDGGSTSSPYLGRFCPGSTAEVKVSSGNQMFVEFESGFAAARGFEAQYSETTDDPSPTVMKPTATTAKPPTSNYHYYFLFVHVSQSPTTVTTTTIIIKTTTTT